MDKNKCNTNTLNVSVDLFDFILLLVYIPPDDDDDDDVSILKC